MKSSLPRLDPEWLSTFLAIAEHGGVLAASRAMHLSQPALSARIQRLEDAVGQSLFDRTNQGMQVNEAGKRLLPIARKLPLLLREALETVDPHLIAETAAPLRLIASSTVSDYVFAPLIAEYLQSHPATGVELLSGNSDEVFAAVRSGRFALGAVEGLTRATGLHLEPFLYDTIIPVYAPGRVDKSLKAILTKPLTSTQVEQLPILWREPGSGTRRVIEESLAHHGYSPHSLRLQYVFGSTMAVKNAVLSGLGIAFLPERILSQELALKRLKRIETLKVTIQRPFSWVMQRGELPAEHQAFYRWINAHFHDQA